MKRIEFALAIVFSFFFVTACNQKKPGKPEMLNKTDTEVSSEDVKRQTGEALETTKNYLIQKKEEYQIQLEDKLNELENKIKDLQAKVANAGEEAKAKYNEMIEALQKKQQEARNKLKELKSASADAWEDVKSGTEAALEDLKKAYNAAVSQFK